ncbi:hypothetical protein HRbin20_01664 [bacterium HR20]|nr:hypothetical protein HRbin20_01664 [bacterium HR20]
MRRDSHDGAGAVLRKHIIGNPDWDFALRRWIERVAACEDSRFLTV